MNFTMDVVENGRSGLPGVPTSMGVSYASHVSGAQVVHQQQAIITAQQVSNATHQQHSHQQQVQLQRIAVHQHQHPAQHVVTVQESPSILSVHQHHQNNHHQHHEQNLDHPSELAVQDISKEEPQEYTPPRVDSVATIVSQSDGMDKHGDDSGLDVMIRVEVRGSIPGITPATLEKDKDNAFMYEFNSAQELVQFFSRSAIAQPIDALNFITPELMRSINPELVRNHFLYVPTSADGGGKASNNNSFTVMAGTQAMTVNNSTNNSATIQLPVSSSGGGGGKHTIKQERKRGELPPGTIIHRPPPPDPNAASVFACWICGLDLQKSLSFEEHMAEVHNVEKPYRCDGCGVTFKRKAHLDRHRRIHLPTRPYQCGICGKGFTRNEHVRRHSYTHSGGIVPVLLQAADSGSRVVVPPGSTILNSPILHQSTNNNGNGVETIFVNGSHSPQSSNNHIESSQQTTVSLVSSSSSQMHHQQQVSVVPSSTSNHVISDVHSVNHTHKKSKNSEDPEKAARPYICEVCQKAFIRNEHLRRHVLTHSGEKPFSCNICNKAFSRREHLTKHARSHHKNSEMVNSVSNGEMNTIHQQVVGNQDASQQHQNIQHASGQQGAPTTIHLVGTVTSEGTLVTGSGPTTNGSGQHIQHHQSSASNHNNSVLSATPGTILSVSSGNGLSHQATIVAQSGSLLNHGAVAQLSNGVPTVVYGMIAEVV